MKLSGPRATLNAAVRHPRIAAGVAAILLAGSVLTVYRPSLWPVGLHPRSLEVAAASTTLLVGGPKGEAVTNYTYEARVNQSLLAGNVLLSPAVVDRVARSLGISPGAIAGYPPVTANVPAALIVPGSSGGPADILTRPGNYRIEVQVDPTVPVIRLFTQAPSASAAATLANATAQGLVSYLRSTQAAADVPAPQRVQVRQLGAATGGTAATSGPAQLVLLLFGASLLVALAVAQPVLRKIATYSSRWGSQRPSVE